MPKYEARANLMVDGLLRTIGDVWDQPATAEVSDLVGAGLIIEARPDGTFAEPPAPAPPSGCCGRR